MQKILLALVLAITVALAFSTTVFAGAHPCTQKIERGVKNVALGWTEIPNSIVNTTKKSNFFVGATVGTVKGIFQTAARTISGAVDILTFPFGTYDQPAVKPSMLPEEAK